MQSPGNIARHHPVFPAPLSLPLKMVPLFVHSKALVAILNRMFDKDLKDGELDFLQDKIVHISVEDADLEYCFTLNKEILIAVDSNKPADLFLKGTVYDYLLLASRREDADTLFFRRQLRMQGDTELGLYVKNFLDGLDMESRRIPGVVESLLQKSLPVYEKLFG